MKKWKIWLLLLASLGIICSCRQPASPIISDEESYTPSSNTMDGDTSYSSDIPQKIIIEDDTLPPKEGMVRSRLTNEWIDPEIADTRPIAVMIPNEIAALPQYNLSKASIIYEANVEWEMTRMMAIFEDWQNIDTIGNIRSLRAYFAYWAFEWDAFLVHFGGPFFINELLAEPDTQNINGTIKEQPAFFRSGEKKAPHNAYATGTGLYKAITDNKYELSYRGIADEEHFRFASKAEPNTLEQYSTGARTASYIDMTGCYPLTRCYFNFNEEDGLYYRSQYLSGGADGPHTDASGEQLCFKNILVQYTKYEDLGEGYLALQCHDDTRDGWFFTNGKGIHINWKKDSDYGATRYYDDNGDEIILNTGKTMICIVEDGDNFTFR